MILRRPLALAALALAAMAGPARAQDPATRPLFEIGIMGGGGYTADYPAADQGRIRGIVSPFLIYRGEVLRADELGARARALRGEDWEFSFSASGAFPTSSDDNRAREGMPDIDWLGEIGPSFQLTLWRDRNPARPGRLILNTPIRAVFSTDLSSIRFRGFTFEPDIAWEQMNLFVPGSRLRVGLSAIFGNERLMDYFYEVDPRFARPGRPAYDAEAGYLGARLSLSYRVPLTERLSVVAGGRIENFSGAANEDSPLFRTEWNYAVAAGFSWTLYRSTATVAAGAEFFD